MFFFPTNFKYRIIWKMTYNHYAFQYVLIYMRSDNYTNILNDWSTIKRELNWTCISLNQLTSWLYVRVSNNPLHPTFIYTVHKQIVGFLTPGLISKPAFLKSKTSMFVSWEYSTTMLKISPYYVLQHLSLWAIKGLMIRSLEIVIKVLYHLKSEI